MEKMVALESTTNTPEVSTRKVYTIQLKKVKDDTRQR